MKILLGFGIGIALIIIAVVLYVALIYTGYVNKKDDTSMDRRNKKSMICSHCKTGKFFYTLDPTSEACPYIGRWEGNQCPHYIADSLET